jgi:hypothetical protein
MEYGVFATFDVLISLFFRDVHPFHNIELNVAVKEYGKLSDPR